MWEKSSYCYIIFLFTREATTITLVMVLASFHLQNLIPNVKVPFPSSLLHRLVHFSLEDFYGKNNNIEIP